MTLLPILASALIATNASPQEIVRNCRAMIPADVELSGRLIMRNRRGIVQSEHTYRLLRAKGEPTLFLDGSVAYNPTPGPILGTDVTWSDVTLDYLWWDDVSFDAAREGETVNGQVSMVLVLKKGERTVRVWIDRKTGALMQAEEWKGDQAVRRLWGTRLKKFGERWMANVMEVETIGSGHRTKITVEELK